jgi:hypothetical protein
MFDRAKIHNFNNGLGQVVNWWFKENVVSLGYVVNWNENDVKDGSDRMGVKIYHTAFILEITQDQYDLDSLLQAAGCRHNNTEPLGTCLDRMIGKVINLDFIKSR